MPDATTQPTVLVKKPDGTFVRVPLSDIQKKPEKPEKLERPERPDDAVAAAQRVQAPATKPTPIQQSNKTIVPANQVVNTSKPLASSLPAAHTAANRWHTPAGMVGGDATSLLEEDAPTNHPALSTVSDDRAMQVNQILRSLPFRVAAPLESRLRTLIQLFIKGIRSLDETREVLLRDSANGGIGLTKNQTQALILVCEEVGGRLVDTQHIPALKNSAITPTPPNRVAPPRAAANPVTAQTQSTLPPRTAAVNEVLKNAPPEPEHFSLKQTTPVRPRMHDVTIRPAAPVGPVDEIRNLTINDFRRLSAKPTDATAIILQKFTNLKNESILQLLDAQSAWRSSPLYIHYISTVARSVGTNQKLTTSSADKQALQWPEMDAIIRLEMQLAHL